MSRFNWTVVSSKSANLYILNRKNEISMYTILTICVLSLITMLKWHSQSRTVAASIIKPTTTPVGRFGYEDNSERKAASLFRGSTTR